METLKELNQRQATEADARHRPIIAAYKSGLTQEAVAAKFDVSRSWVQKVLRRAKQRGTL